MGNNVTFSWKNYTKPTPSNLEAIAKSLRKIVAIIAGTTMVMQAVWWVPFSIIVLGAVLDELKDFFAKVNHDYQEVVHINVPPDMEEKVVITQDESEPKNE